MQDQSTMTPEAGSPATWYGSAIHDVIHAIEEGFTEEAAIEVAWSEWGAHLYAEDLALLKADVALFRTRDFENVRTVLAEGEIRVPLTEMPDGRQVWFRGKIDRLYERLDRPGHFIHVDYKSSKWNKTQDEVDEDPQMWSYNWALHEYLPEIEDLEQWYDQLRHGMVSTAKNDEQREEIREWLAIEARAYFAEQELQADGLPAPTFNQWCPWCSIVDSCAIVPRLSAWALTRIEELSPADLDLDTVTPLDEYMERYTEAQTAIKVLERYTGSVKALLRELPIDRREELGFYLSERRNSVIPPRSMSALYEALGHDRFMGLVKVTQERLKSIPDETQRDFALSLVEKVPGTQVVNRKRR